ncbi:MAG: [FeFe] hydrogenase H-cluster radical SAM maturase HydE [Elusimicrobiales bacterium]
MTKDGIAALLNLEGEKEKELFRLALETKLRYTGKKVYLRGIVELGNICAKNCLYCGIRRDNAALPRYQMSAEEIVRAALWAYEGGYGSVVLQSGERSGEDFIALIESALSEIREKTAGKLAVTLSLGEQSARTYKRWLDAGARRYLLRIETSDPQLYEKLHPPDHSFAARLECLHILRDLGYQLGTGVMIGLPYQTIDQLAGDIVFFRKMDVDMIGMGPYIASEGAPLASLGGGGERNFSLSLKMIAAARLEMPDVNIAATTALQALHPQGRELGIQAGANVVMPNITDVKYRRLYQLYDGKPCLDENAQHCRACLERRIISAGGEAAPGDPGDPLHYSRRMRRKNYL